MLQWIPPYQRAMPCLIQNENEKSLAQSGGSLQNRAGETAINIDVSYEEHLQRLMFHQLTLCGAPNS